MVVAVTMPLAMATDADADADADADDTVNAATPIWSIAIHGGAGGDPDRWTDQQRQTRRDAMDAAVDLGGRRLAAGDAAVDVVQAVIMELEDNASFNAGRGAVVNVDGVAELDASIMDGRTAACGGVAGVRRVKNPIAAARLVMTRTPHVLLVGDGADAFAKSQQLALVEPDYFLSRSAIVEPHFGTVGCVVRDVHGNLAAGTSTGGTKKKLAGRVGDSPLIGAGTYASNQSCAVSGTGIGEEYIRHAIAHEVSARMRHAGQSLPDAVNHVLRETLNPGVGGLIALDADGHVVMQYNTDAMICAVASSRMQRQVFLQIPDRRYVSADPTRRLPGTFDRPFGWNKQSRSMAVAKHAMAATSHPVATQAALDVLRRGGNAVDAAIAANAMLTVVEPMSCGLGGDLFAMVWDAQGNQLHGLNASGRSPANLTIDEFRKRGLETIPLSGELSWSVPGCVSGWQALHQRFGVAAMEDLLLPAAAVAEDGFVVTPVIAGYWKKAEEALGETEPASQTFLVDGQRAPEVGTVFKNPDAANTLRRLATAGWDDFYRGQIADQLVRYSDQVGGYLTKSDLANHRADWVQPVGVDYRGYRVWELPPNGQGIAALQMLKVLEGFDLQRYGPGHPEYLHRLVEAKKLAFADRARYYADPSMVDVPVDELISQEYADRQRTRIDVDQAAVNLQPGDPRLQDGDTIYLTVVDKDRNVCSLIQSTYHGFGSKRVPEGLGFALQNRGALFVLDDEHPNRYQPGKRPFHTIIPAMVTREDRPEISFGVMGGDMQPQGHVQVLVNLIDFEMDLQAAGDAARIRHVGSATPAGVAEQPGGGTVVAESGISESALTALRNRGHQVRRGNSGMGGYQAIRIDWENGTLQGATEARKDGIALGY